LLWWCNPRSAVPKDVRAAGGIDCVSTLDPLTDPVRQPRFPAAGQPSVPTPTAPAIRARHHAGGDSRAAKRRRPTDPPCQQRGCYHRRETEPFERIMVLAEWPHPSVRHLENNTNSKA
jgi:hypothetical protein